MYSVREPRISPSMVKGERPAKRKTGARPQDALCTAAPLELELVGLVLSGEKGTIARPWTLVDHPPGRRWQNFSTKCLQALSSDVNMDLKLDQLYFHKGPGSIPSPALEPTSQLITIVRLRIHERGCTYQNTLRFSSQTSKSIGH